MRREESLKGVLREPLDAQRVDAIWRRIEGKRQRVVPPHVLFTVATTCTLLAVLAWFRSGAIAPRATDPPRARLAPTTSVQPVALRFANGSALSTVEVEPSAPLQTLALSDGTRITLAGGGRLVPRVSSPDRFEVAIERGRARFEVSPQGNRHFAVFSGSLSVEVVGTVFSVERREQQVDVVVEHGRVRVRSSGLSGGEMLLGAGQSLRWPPASSEQPSPVAPQLIHEQRIASVPTVAQSQPSAVPASTMPDARWHDASAAGDYARAYALLGDRGYARAVREANGIEGLLELADLARASGQPRQAALALSRVLARYPGDARTALAALTLGRMQLDSLAEPRAAVRMLRRALELGLPDALQEDALARLVQAHAQSRDREQAQRAAEQYKKRFPNGRWGASVEQWAVAR